MDKKKKLSKSRIFSIIQIGSKDDLPSRIFDIIIAGTIIINILVMFLETFDELSEYFPAFRALETATIIFFCAEYILRIWTADHLYPELSRSKAVLRFLISFDGVIDLLTILPLTLFSGFVAFRMLRVVRIFHLFRINQNDDSFSVITSVLYEKKNQIISSVFIIFVLMLASSLGIYNAEHDVQPDVYKNAFSGIWWSVSTLLTVGYGDIYPVTVMGRIMAIFIAFLGVGAVAIPTGIISAGFVEQYSQKENATVKFRDLRSIGEIEIDHDSPLAGHTVGEIKQKYGIDIYMIIRDDLSLIAADKVKIRRRDVLISSSDKLEHE